MPMNPFSKNAVVTIVWLTWFGVPTASAETSVTELRHHTSKQLRLESVAKAGPAKDDAATALCDLYVVLRSDPRFAESKMLQGDAAKVRRRLLTIARRREIQLGRRGIERPENLSRQVEETISKAFSGQEQPSADTNPIPPTTAAGGSVAGSGAAIGIVGGGGWQLVELIQRIVAPDFWGQQGGKGTIHYFAMRRILVVRATSEVHEQVKELLAALR
jgi:hypothetical protein